MEIVIAIIGSSATASLVSGIISIIMTHQKKDDGLTAGVRILLYDRIKHLGKAYIDRTYVTYEEYEDLKNMHKVYHDALGGNGFLDGLMNQVDSLPKRTK